MTTEIGSDASIDQFLEHHGVRGMKWGVRRRGRIERHVKVGKGKGNIIDKARVYSMSNPADLIRTRSFRKSAARKGKRFVRRNQRIASGKAKVFKDILPTYGSVRYGDLLPAVGKGPLTADKKRNLHRMSSGREFAIAALGLGVTAVAARGASRVLKTGG